MTRFLILLAFLVGLAPAVQAQSLMTLLGAGPARSSGGYLGPGDLNGSAIAFWGLRAYSSAQTSGSTAAVKLVRASDSRTCDVLLNASGGLGNTASCSNAGDNGTAVATWCNATTCTIDILYDQTGNARHALANSSTNRATLTFNCVNVNRPCADFGANVAYYNASTFPDTAQPVTVSFVAIRTGNTAAQNTILGRGAAPAREG